MKKLYDMVLYCENDVDCRRTLMLEIFGETFHAVRVFTGVWYGCPWVGVWVLACVHAACRCGCGCVRACVRACALS